MSEEAMIKRAVRDGINLSLEGAGGEALTAICAKAIANSRERERQRLELISAMKGLRNDIHNTGLIISELASTVKEFYRVNAIVVNIQRTHATGRPA